MLHRKSQGAAGATGRARSPNQASSDPAPASWTDGPKSNAGAPAAVCPEDLGSIHAQAHRASDVVARLRADPLQRQRYTRCKTRSSPGAISDWTPVWPKRSVIVTRTPECQLGLDQVFHPTRPGKKYLMARCGASHISRHGCTGATRVYIAERTKPLRDRLSRPRVQPTEAAAQEEKIGYAKYFVRHSHERPWLRAHSPQRSNSYRGTNIPAGSSSSGITARGRLHAEKPWRPGRVRPEIDTRALGPQSQASIACGAGRAPCECSRVKGQKGVLRRCRCPVTFKETALNAAARGGPASPV